MAWKIEPRSIKKPIENTMKKRRHLGDVLAASWLVLEASWGVPKSTDAAGPGRGGGDAGATPRKGFLKD